MDVRQRGGHPEADRNGAAGVTVTCFGRFTVEFCGHAVTSWGAGKARALFQHLLCNPDRVIAKEALLEVLWANEGTEPNASSLKVAAHGVRTTLRQAPAHLGDAACTLDFVGCGYVLHLRGATVDVLEFERLLTRYRCAIDPDDGVAQLTQAANLYRGHFLPGESAVWVLQRREWYRGQVLRALSLLRERAGNARRYDDLRQLCGQTLSVDSCNEDAYRALMAMHAAHGQLSEARRWFDVCRAQLRGTLGVDPAEDTMRMAARLFRVQHPAVRLPGAVPRTRAARTGTVPSGRSVFPAAPNGQPPGPAPRERRGHALVSGTHNREAGISPS
jgi:two-component SAPR family response regulator